MSGTLHHAAEDIALRLITTKTAARNSLTGDDVRSCNDSSSGNKDGDRR